MAHSPDVDTPFHPNFLVATAVSEAFPNDDIVLRPQDVDGLADTFTVIHIGEVVDGIYYFAGIYGEHDLDTIPVNPMNLNPLVLGVQLTDGRLTVADALSVEKGTQTIGVANVLMLAQYGEELTTDQQPPADPDHKEWTVRLEEYPDTVTCCRLAIVDYDDSTYSFYFGAGLNDGTTEYFLLVVQLIGGDSFPVDTADDELWDALLDAFLSEFGIEADDGSGGNEDGLDEEPDESGFADINIC